MKTNFNDFETKTKNEYSMFKSWRDTPNEDNMRPMLEYLKPTINSALMSFVGGDTSFKPKAYILTAKAIETYDPDKGAGLKTHVYNNLKRLQRVRAERQAVVRIPENIRLDALQINKFSTEFIDTHGREPAVEEVSDGLGLSKRRIKKASLYGSEQPITKMTGEQGDVLVSTGKSEEDTWTDYVYFDMDPVNKKIFEWTTGYGGTKIIPKKDIAAKLGITSAAVSSRINTIMRKMNERTA